MFIEVLIWIGSSIADIYIKKIKTYMARCITNVSSNLVLKHVIFKILVILILLDIKINLTPVKKKLQLFSVNLQL